MQSQINKWGNSAAVRIPASILADMDMSIHSRIDIKAVDGKIIIEPAKPTRKSVNLPFSEEFLLQGLDAHNAHAEEAATPLITELGEI